MGPPKKRSNAGGALEQQLFLTPLSVSSVVGFGPGGGRLHGGTLGKFAFTWGNGFPHVNSQQHLHGGTAGWGASGASGCFGCFGVLWGAALGFFQGLVGGFGRAEHSQNTCFGASRGSKAREIKPRNPRKIGGFGWGNSVFARFGCVLGVKNAAKPNENVVFPDETS